MATEDKLEPEERLRLEALAQAINYSASHPRSNIAPGPEQVIATAKEFEQYISGV